MANREMTDAQKYAEETVYPGEETVLAKGLKILLENKLCKAGLPNLNNISPYESTVVGIIMVSVLTVAENSYELILKSSANNMSIEGQLAFSAMLYEDGEGINPFNVPVTLNQVAPILKLIGEIDWDHLKLQVSRSLN